MKQKHLLVADSDPAQVDIIKQLTEADYKVLTAADLTQTLTVLHREAGTVDAIILDTALPDMERCRMIRKIKQLSAFSEIPILVLSEKPNDSEESSALRYGASDYMRKPFCPNVFLHRLQHLTAPTYRTKLFYPQELEPITGVLSQESFCIKAERLICESPNAVFRIVCAEIRNLNKLRKRHTDGQINRLYRFTAQILTEQVCMGQGAIGFSDHKTFLMCLPFHEPQLLANIAAAREAISYYPIEPEVQIQFGIAAVSDDSLPMEELCEQAISVIGNEDSLHGCCFSKDILQQHDAYLRFADDLGSLEPSRRFDLQLAPCFDLTDATYTHMLVTCYHPRTADSGISVQALADRSGNCAMQQKLDLVYLSLVTDYALAHPVCSKTIILSLRLQTLMFPGCAALLTEHLVQTEPPTHYAVVFSAVECLKHIACLEQTAAELHTAGFQVMLDGLTPENPQWELFLRFHPDAIILDAAAFCQIKDFRARSALLNTIIRDAKHLQIPLIGKNIETQEAFSFLRSIGCNIGSGAYLCPPLSAKEFPDWHASPRTETIQRICNPLLTQQDIWDIGSAFNRWFDCCAGAMILLEVQQDILSMLRANDSFFSQFHTKRTLFSACTQTFAAFLPPSDVSILLQACYSVRNTGREQHIRFSMRSPGNDKYHAVQGYVRTVFNASRSFAVLLSVSRLPTDAEFRKPHRRKNTSDTEEGILCLTDMLTDYSDEYA